MAELSGRKSAVAGGRQLWFQQSLQSIRIYSVSGRCLVLQDTAEPGHAGDGGQRPLRSRCPPRLMPSVAMTSNVKSWQQIFSGLHDVFYPSCIGRAGASNMRRLILRLSVGWLPPYLHPSGACLNLGSSILY